jgi:hypothetical protein
MADHDWAMDQVLRSSAVAAVVAWPERLDGRTFRRWQLAAEQGDGVGLLLRSAAAARNDPSWADVRLLVEPLAIECATACSQVGPSPTPTNSLLASKQWHTPLSSKRLLRIVLLRCRGGADGRTVEVEIDDETYRVHPAAERRLQDDNCKLQIAN